MSQENHASRLVAAVAVVASTAAVASVLLAGGADDAGRSGGVRIPEWAGLPAYQRRCEQLDLVGARGRIVYERQRQMTRGDATTVVAAVTLDQSLPPDRVLRREDATAESGLVVSCRVQARLSGSQYDFDIDREDWIERSLLTSDTARWSWYVSPKIGGDHNLSLKVRPIVQFRRTDGSTVLIDASRSNVQEYETRVHVKVPWSERPQETMSRLAATFKVAEELITALTALLLAIPLLVAAFLGLRFWKKKKPGPGDTASA